MNSTKTEFQSSQILSHKLKKARCCTTITNICFNGRLVNISSSVITLIEDPESRIVNVFLFKNQKKVLWRVMLLWTVCFKRWRHCIIFCLWACHSIICYSFWFKEKLTTLMFMTLIRIMWCNFHFEVCKNHLNIKVVRNDTLIWND